MKSRIILGICISLLFAGLVSADTSWTGAIDELWSNPDNWSNGLPSLKSGQNRIMLPDSMCLLDIPVEIHTTNVGGHLRLVDGAEFNATGYTYLGWSAGNEGLMEVLGGVVNTQLNTAVGNFGSATLIIDYAGVFNQNDQFISLGNKSSGSGRVELRGGLLNITSSWEYSLRLAPADGATASMDFSGGTLMQPFTDARLVNINDNIANGTITAYGSVGTVLVETTEENVLVVKGLHPRNPVPEDGDIVTIPGNITLSWTVDEGTPVDVWFGTSPDLISAELIVEKQVVTSVGVTVEPKQRYYWAVDTYAPGAADPNWGPIFDFVVDNKPPEVKAGDDVATWLDNGSLEVAIAAAVTDADPTTTLWTVITEPNEGMAVIANPDQTETTVTLSALGTYVLQLEADDGEYTGSDTLTIGVFSDHCEAAKSLPGWTPSTGDINLDCVVDQLDMDILLEHWLECTGLDCPDPNAL